MPTTTTSNSITQRSITPSNNTTRGVSLGGWLVLEPWITPSLFSKQYGTSQSVDQWTWMQDAFTKALNKTQGNQSLALQTVSGYLNDHFSSFINESDIEAISQAGLNTIRIPIGHWTFDTVPWEPYLNTSIELPHIENALRWAKKYNLSVHLDLHTAPNSQNGYPSSGRSGPVNFARINATQNMERTANALTQMVNTFVCKSNNSDVVTSILLLNEPLVKSLGQQYIGRSYMNLYTTVKEALDACMSLKERPIVAMHDGYVDSLSDWYSFFSNNTIWQPGTFNVETHVYHSFAPQNTYSHAQHISEIQKFGDSLAGVLSYFPLTIGEFSLSIGTKYAVKNSSTSGDIMQQTLDELSTPTQNLFYRQFWEAQVTAFELCSGWIFWTWKTENSPDWSYQVALQQGWIPIDPTERVFQKTKSGGVSNKLIGPAPSFGVQTSSSAHASVPSPLLGKAIVAVLLLLIFS